ncbi:MAG: allantoicase [Bacteroidota bacterium]
MSTLNIEAAAFAGLVDLASERLGGKALLASDEFFAPKENLLKPGRGMFIPDKYTDRGKWMDGWETRRKRVKGHDWCIIKLGLAGILKGVDIDTNHFLGNNPAYTSIEACAANESATARKLISQDIQWTEILSKSPIKPGSQNIFSVSSQRRWTHLRLNIYPDGGVARFRAYGEVVPDWSRAKAGPKGAGQVIDLVAIQHGGLAVAASDMFFSPMNNLIMPGRAATMRDGWETRRRRGPGYDWVIIKLGRKGYPRKVEVDTNHFKGNYPDRCSIDVCNEPAVDSLNVHSVGWTEILPKTKLKPHTRHFFEKELKKAGPATHVRLNIYPDGGVSRLRVWGRIAE